MKKEKEYLPKRILLFYDYNLNPAHLFTQAIIIIRNYNEHLHASNVAFGTLLVTDSFD